MQGEPDALSEGRRVYLGNLLYVIKPHDVEEALTDSGFGELEKIHISIDPVSARNPGYCFVDFHDRETADRAIASLSATIRGRSVKVGPCEPKKRQGRSNGDGGGDRSAFRRWGDWSADGTDGGSSARRFDRKDVEHGPNGALDHFDDMVQGSDGRRLYVGGLGKMVDQAQNSREMTELFADFNPTAIGKRITPHESTRAKPGNHHYCFVDFETKEQAAAAMQALKGRPYLGGNLKVSLAKAIPEQLVDGSEDVRHARRWNNENASRPEQSSSGNTREPSRAQGSMDWRKKAVEKAVE